MDTPIIAQYYRETEPEKRKELLEQAIASGEDQEANKIRKEIWEARYKGTTNEGGIADGYLKFWMALEFNRNAGHKVFGSGRAQKEIRKELDDVKFREIRAKSALHEELLHRECQHLVRFYMDLYETAILLPQEIGLEEDLDLLTKAAREMYELQFPGERLPE